MSEETPKPKWRPPSTRVETAPDRFLKKCIPEPNTGCLLWVGGMSHNAYGSFHDGHRMCGAHHYSWRLHRGPIPSGMLVCHRCDTPLCVNPDHLFLGTHSDNQRDRTKKGRAPRVFAWSIPDDIKEKIRADTRPYRVLAEEYGLAFLTVKYIKSARVARGTDQDGRPEPKRRYVSEYRLKELENEIERLRAALERIAEMEPATQEITVANAMAEEARTALAGS